MSSIIVPSGFRNPAFADELKVEMCYKPVHRKCFNFIAESFEVMRH